ncbi:MAG: GNAT family N-acetyltransferase [Verrucomicrobiae bacterium]|nr:GNAT family N-acetyltransferase [Verrucomicrobiae bacterium]
MSYRVESYRPEHRDGVLEIQKHLWSPHREINDAFMSWKYENNPYIRNPQIYLALSGEKVVGMRGAFGCRWFMGQPQSALSVACMGDFVIDPAHRNKGLFTKIMQFALADLLDQGYEYVFSLSANHLNQLSALAMGWRSLGILDVRLRTGLAFRIRRKIRHHLKLGEEDPSGLLDRKLNKPVFKDGRTLVLEKEPRLEQMAALVNEIPNDNRLRHDKSVDFFRWRFNNPLCQYRFLYTGALDGYLVLQTFKFRDQGLVNIVDWEAKDMDTVRCLLRTAVGLCKYLRLSFTLPRFESELLGLIDQLGFERKIFASGIGEYKPTILMRALSAGPIKGTWTLGGMDLVNPETWDMRHIYSDEV